MHKILQHHHATRVCFPQGLRSYLTANKMVGETERWSCLKIRRDVFCLKCHNELNLLHSSWCGLCIINSPDSQSKSRGRTPLNWKIKKRILNDTFVTLMFVCLRVSNLCWIKRKGIILVHATGARIFHLLKCRKVLIIMVINKASFSAAYMNDNFILKIGSF